MIRRPDADMLPRLKQIWQQCFGDDARGTDFVFANLLGPMQMLVEVDEGGQPVAMLNWKLLQFQTPEPTAPQGLRTLAGAYIFGIATLPEHRGKGISTALLGSAHELLAKEGAALACLIPAQGSLFDFYAARGFGTRFFYNRLRLDRTQIPQPRMPGVLSVASLSDFATLRAAAFAGRSLFGAWDEGYLRYVMRECRFYGGEVLRFSCAGSVGYAVCYPRPDGTLLVKEAALQPRSLSAFLAALDTRYHAKNYHIRLPTDFPTDTKLEITPLGMIKWYDKDCEQAQAQGGAPWFAFGLDD